MFISLLHNNILALKGLDLKILREKNNLTQEELGRKLGKSMRTVITWEKSDELSKSQVNQINAVFNSKSEITSQLNESTAKYKTEAISVDFTEMNVMMVPLVSKFAYAGYLDNLGDDEYIGDMPTVAFANDVQNKGDYLAFEVKGDSMDNGLSNAILEGDILLARNIRHDFWRSKLHIRKWNFIIVHKERGILIKRITEHNTETNELTLHSLNDYYEDIKIHLKDVQAIYNVVDSKRKPII